MKILLIISFVTLISFDILAQQPDSVSIDTVQREKFWSQNFELSDANAPIFVMNEELITEQQLQGIKVDDIASITVLKDSAATAVFGEKARNGVILIETKTKKPKPKN